MSSAFSRALRLGPGFSSRGFLFNPVNISANDRITSMNDENVSVITHSY